MNLSSNFIIVFLTFLFVSNFSLANFEIKELLLNNLSKSEQEMIKSKLPGLKAIMFVGYLKGCPIFKKYQNTMAHLKNKYKDQLLIINFDPSRNANKTKKESLRDLIEMNNKNIFISDKDGRLNSKLKVSTASEAVIVDTRSYTVVYRGAIDDQNTYDYSKPAAGKNHVEDIIRAITNNEELQFYTTTTFGCALNIAETN